MSQKIINLNHKPRTRDPKHRHFLLANLLLNDLANAPDLVKTLDPKPYTLYPIP